MSPRQEPHAPLARLRAVPALTLVAGLALALAGCSGSSGPTGAEPGGTTTSVAGTTGAAAATEAPDVTPTRASSGLETPLPRSAPKPTLQTAAAATGLVLVGAAHPGVECVYFAWLPQGPAVPEGAAFVVSHVRVQPAAWSRTKVACQEDPVRCVGAALTSQPGSSSCAVALARKDGPHATGPTGATLQLIGSLRCGAPATRAQCAAFVADLVAHAHDPGRALSLDDPIPADDSGTDGTTGSGDDGTGNPAGDSDSGSTGDVSPTSGG